MTKNFEQPTIFSDENKYSQSIVQVKQNQTVLYRIMLVFFYSIRL